MTLNNKMVSQNQTFRIGILENITLGMVVIPYICVNLAGRWHFVAFLVGLILAGAYMVAIYYLSQRLPRDLGNRLKSGGALDRVVSILYTLRFVLRAGLIMLFFGKTIQEFMLRSFNLWVIIIAFAIVCGYGGAKDIEKRGRMLELLYPWMIIPVILVAVFSISSIDLEELYRGLMGIDYDLLHQGAGTMDVIKGGYVAFLVLSSTELMLFTLPHQKENNWRNTLKTGIWILIAIFLAYVFVIGILGGHWVASDSQASLNVMEAAFVPGEVLERADYPVLAFWIIGVFAIISGYMFYAKEAFLIGTRLWNRKNGRLGLWLVMAAVVILAYVWSLDSVSRYLAKYMLWADVGISIIIPVVFIAKGGGWSVNNKLSGKKDANINGNLSAMKKATLMIMLCLMARFVTGCDMDLHDEAFKPLGRNQGSIEDRDYVTAVIIKDDEIIFTVADIKKYLSDATGDFETKEEKAREDSLEDALEEYYEDKGRYLDLGHMTEITFESIGENELWEYVLEMGNMPSLGKSVTVKIKGGQDGQPVEIPLRNLIKMAYSGENLPYDK